MNSQILAQQKKKPEKILDICYGSCSGLLPHTRLISYHWDVPKGSPITRIGHWLSIYREIIFSLIREIIWLNYVKVQRLEKRQ